MSIARPREDTEITLVSAIDQLSRVKHLVEAIFMAAFALDDRNDINAIQHVVECIHGEIDKLDGMLEAIREGEAS